RRMSRAFRTSRCRAATGAARCRTARRSRARLRARVIDMLPRRAAPERDLEHTRHEGQVEKAVVDQFREHQYGDAPCPPAPAPDGHDPLEREHQTDGDPEGEPYPAVYGEDHDQQE